jgi:hypothetical protein
MRRKEIGVRGWGCIVTLAYVAWAVLFLPGLRGRELLFGIVVCSLFLVFYLVPIAVFSARIELTEMGLRVRQYGETIVPYSDVLRCYSLFVVPFQILLVITRRSLPLKVLYCTDRLTKPRKSLMQDGEIASALKARMRRTGAAV